MEGLPKTLEIMLGTMVDNFTLKSWQIFNENDGICMKIRFRAVPEQQRNTVLPQEKAIKFKKVSPSQLKRDQNRAKEYHQRANRMDSAISEPEMTRSDDVLQEGPAPVTPETVESDSTLGSPCSIEETPIGVVKVADCDMNCEMQVSNCSFSGCYNEDRGSQCMSDINFNSMIDPQYSVSRPEKQPLCQIEDKSPQNEQTYSPITLGLDPDIEAHKKAERKRMLHELDLLKAKLNKTTCPRAQDLRSRQYLV